MGACRLRDQIIKSYVDFVPGFPRINDPDFRDHVRVNLIRGALLAPLVNTGPDWTAHGPIAQKLGAAPSPRFDTNAERPLALDVIRDQTEPLPRYVIGYRLVGDDLADILGAFPIVRRANEKANGAYRTKRLCLDAYDRFARVQDATACGSDPVEGAPTVTTRAAVLPGRLPPSVDTS